MANIILKMADNKQMLPRIRTEAWGIEKQMPSRESRWLLDSRRKCDLLPNISVFRNVNTGAAV